MTDGLWAIAGTIVCATILYGCDVSTFSFLADPIPERKNSVWLLGWLSLAALVGLYVSGVLFCISGLLAVGQAVAGGDWRPTRPLATVCVVGTLAATFFVRALIKGLAARRKFPRKERPFPVHAGASEPWFVAMQYYALVLNRTYKVFVTDAMLCGAKVRGLTASPPIPLDGQLRPNDWANTLASSLYDRLDVTSAAFLKMNFANFQMHWQDIDRVEFDASPKWGMGNVPYSGRIFLRLKSGRSKELILLGSQDGPTLADQLNQAKAKCGLS